MTIYIHPTALSNPIAVSHLETATGMRAVTRGKHAVLVPTNVTKVSFCGRIRQSAFTHTFNDNGPSAA